MSKNRFLSHLFDFFSITVSTWQACGHGDELVVAKIEIFDGRFGECVRLELPNSIATQIKGLKLWNFT